LIAHYFPGINLDELDEWGFAFWSENAQWMHSQQILIQQANMMGMLGGGGGAPKQQSAPRPPGR